MAPDRVADNWTDKLDVLKPEIMYDWVGNNRLPEDARDPLPARSMKSDKAAPRYVKHLHQAQRWSSLLNSGVELCSPHQVPSWDKNHQHPTSATAVRSAYPRWHTNISQRNATDSMRTKPTAVRSPALRYTHPNNKRPRTNPYKTWTLHLMICVINVMALLYYSGDGGAEPCSPPASTTLATCNTTMTHHVLVNGGAERCSPPKTPTTTTVRKPCSPLVSLLRPLRKCNTRLREGATPTTWPPPPVECDTAVLAFFATCAN